MTLQLGEIAAFRTVGENLQRYRFWRPSGYSRSGTIMLLPGTASDSVTAAGLMAPAGEWIFSPEDTSEDPIQVRDLANLIRRIEFRYDLYLEDLTLIAAGPHTLPALTWVAITQPELKALVLVQPTLEFADLASQEVVRRLIEAAPSLEVPTQVLLGDSRKILEEGPTRTFFENLGSEFKLLSTVPTGGESWLGGVDAPATLRKVMEFTRTLQHHPHVEVA